MMRDFKNYSLLPHNTFGIDVQCSRFLEYETVTDAKQVAIVLREADAHFLIVGGGSNLLLTGDFDGVVVHSALKGIEKLVADEKNTVCLRCGSGEAWNDVVTYALSHQLYGAENLSFIPGDVGASAVQNIGAYGVEVKDLIVKVEAVEIATGSMVEFSNADCCYAYRQSRFKQDWKNRYLITHVTYQFFTSFCPHLNYGNIRVELEKRGIITPKAEELRQVIIDIRNEKLPDVKIEGNAGSFFMNPIVERAKYEELAGQYPDMPHYIVDAHHEKIPAGWMIDQCGWKGKSLGKAGVHGKQALVLVNHGGAQGSDIVRLMETIQQDVEAKFGIRIFPEVNIV